MKYPELTNLCKNCTGCQRLEDEYFKGVEQCEYRKSGFDLCKKIIEGVQTKLWQKKNFWLKWKTFLRT